MNLPYLRDRHRFHGVSGLAFFAAIGMTGMSTCFKALVCESGVQSFFRRNMLGQGSLSPFRGLEKQISVQTIRNPIKLPCPQSHEA